MAADFVTGSGSSGFVFANPNARSIGNPSSMHGFGASIGAAVKEARRQVKALIGAECDHEIAFTSGGTESSNAAILSALDGVAGVGRSRPSSSVLEDRIGSMISALRRQVTIGAQAGNARVDELIGNCQ
ncbi:aminotransferase class V-fold PLP-dependent enzyme [Microvirga tunisiensis]|uniref:Aminotransferase class V-fold PLP-dependent enzyme n=1 Tax=Microvirga tunisiensis TaxID=2108360 RepID=A0A5N7MR52_9HYPH|nr:aminotransferase class V-fold PLP-dependent enzyme [Microvirga tunisiensis]MPR29433.1 aminotransferase class V-fold PLP-dependent enzyme [Microvirga tunisiensis]